MAPKAKGKAKGKAKAGYAAEPQPEEPVETAAELAAKAEARRLWQVRKDASKFVATQLEALRGVPGGLIEAAKERAKKTGPCDWLVVAMEFHEKKLVKLEKRFADKKLDGLDQEFKDGIEAFVAQFTPGSVETFQQDTLKVYQEVWDMIPPEEGEGYTRPAETKASNAVLAELKDWSDGSEKGITQFVTKMKSQAASGGVQETGLIRIGGLFGEAERGATWPGLTAAALMPAISDGMKAHLDDAMVQRAGCAALRGLAKADGQLSPLCDSGGPELVVAAIVRHYKVVSVVMTATASVREMAEKAGKSTPEHAAIIAAGPVDPLLKVMTHHAWDQTLCGQVRVVLPFLIAD